VTWIWLPWRRWQDAERRADAAEFSLEAARAEHREAQRLAAESRALRAENGFAEMVRIATGVR
jgi:hypothetical protein